MSSVILSVSFGTSDAEARETCILPVEEAYAKAFPDMEVRRAFTSGFIRRKLAKEGIVIDSAEEAVDRVKAEGKEPVLAVTHIIPGQEYNKVREMHPDLKITEPLLANEDDLERMASILGEIRAETGGILVMMGHGTEHAADETYRCLRAKLPECVFLACVEGTYTLDTVIPELQKAGERRVTLMPLMLVAGDHARNDMAGDDEDSWRSVLTAKGFDVSCRIAGLGTLAQVREMFIEKLRSALKA